MICSKTPITHVSVPKNSRITEKNDNRTSIKAECTRPGRNVSLYYRTADMLVPELFYAESSDLTEVACAVSLVPTFEPITPEDFFKESIDQKPKATKFTEGRDFEFIFLIDRSGSMSGSRIRMAVEALKLFICSLPEECSFNIISFGSNWDRLHVKEAFMTFNQDTKVEVLDTISGFSATYGGTDILSPL